MNKFRLLRHRLRAQTSYIKVKIHHERQRYDFKQLKRIKKIKKSGKVEKLNKNKKNYLKILK